MTGQSLLNMMELVNQELQLQTGEADVVRGLVALNVAQDYFESLAALRFGNAKGTVTTTANTETTAFPTGLLRLDRLQTISSVTNRPDGELRRMRRTGGHAMVNGAMWPVNLTTSPGSGKPTGYWTDTSFIYWSPTPDAVYTVRWYGFQAQTDITASGTFLYPDLAAFPMASFAARLMKTGLDDPANDLASLAQESFKAALDNMEMSVRDGADELEYTEIHTA